MKSECLTGLEVDEHGRLRMYGYQKHIQVKLEVPGYHRWLSAPEEVAFLRFYHRHVFNIRVQIEIDNDRQLEYFLVQHKLKEIVNDYIARQVDLTKDYDPEDFYELTGQGTGMEEQDVLVINSCEDFAEWLVYRLEKTYGEDTAISCLVSEDDENGSIVLNFN